MMNLSTAELKKISENRSIYLWGARKLGFSCLNSFEREGIPVTGFLDSSTDLQGKTVVGMPVFPPQDIITTQNKDNFIVITSGMFADEISNECEDLGFKRETDFVQAKDLQTFDYEIDVSGTCNLRCISCPRGNLRHHPKPGFMRSGIFEKVLDKIIREDPMIGAVDLYNVGEPLLNRDLPEIVEICNSRGIFSALSSNLNIRNYLAETIKAKPTWFRVSTSGYGSSYEITHTGGNWDTFLENMYLLANLRDKYNPEMDVEVLYHIYKDRAEDFKKMSKLCSDLKFTLRVRYAVLLPIDNAYYYSNHETLTPEAMSTQQLQILSVGEVMEMARKTIHVPCAIWRLLAINWDLSVKKCTCWYDPKQDLPGVNFLETPIDEIIRLRTDCDLCIKCKKAAVHRYLTPFSDEKLIKERINLSYANNQ
jgi:MoaA/NifB/PqqE/SkfB family radical SAM enzyme